MRTTSEGRLAHQTANEDFDTGKFSLYDLSLCLEPVRRGPAECAEDLRSERPITKILRIYGIENLEVKFYRDNTLDDWCFDTDLVVDHRLRRSTG